MHVCIDSQGVLLTPWCVCGDSEYYVAHLPIVMVMPSNARSLFPAVSSRDIRENQLTTLHSGIFGGLASLETL